MGKFSTPLQRRSNSSALKPGVLQKHLNDYVVGSSVDAGQSTDNESTARIPAPDFDDYQNQNSRFLQRKKNDSNNGFYKTMQGLSPSASSNQNKLIMSKWNNAFASNYTVTKSPKKVSPISQSQTVE